MIDFESNLRPREPMKGPRIVLFVAILHMLIGLSALYYHTSAVPPGADPQGFVQHLLDYIVRILYFPVGHILAWLPDAHARGNYSLMLLIGWSFIWGLMVNALRKLFGR